jgi:hypothetical protein
VSAGSITLDQVAAHTAVLAVACSRCDRAGRYTLDTLIARHGPGLGIPELLRLLSKDCPKRQSLSAYDLCGVPLPRPYQVLPDLTGQADDDHQIGEPPPSILPISVPISRSNSACCGPCASRTRKSPTSRRDGRPPDAALGSWRTSTLPN